MNALLVLCKYDWYLMTKYVDLTSIYDPMVATLAMQTDCCKKYPKAYSVDNLR